MNNANVKEKALQWFKLGINVLATRKEQKKDRDYYQPLIEWSQFQTRRMTEAEFNSQPWKLATNFALVLGKLPSGKWLCLFDFDDHEGAGVWKDADFMSDCFSYLEKSPHGYHVLLLSDVEPRECKDYKELELLCAGRICNMYPDSVLKDVPLVESRDVNIEFRQAVLHYHLKPKKKPYANLSLEELLSQGVAEGGRDDRAIFIASKLRAANKTKEETLAILLKWNTLNIPPLQESIIKQKVKSAFSTENPYFGKKKKSRVTREELRDIVYKKLIKAHNFAALPNGALYVYTNGAYATEGTAENLTIKPEATAVLKERYEPQDTLQIIDRIKGTFPKEIDFFSKVPVDLVCLENGILNVKTLELTPHTPELGFLAKLPVKYDPASKCPEIQKAIHAWCYEEGNPQKTEEKEKTMYEFIGYCLTREVPYHKALFLEGETGNGKTTFYNLMTAFIGIENSTRIPLEHFGDRFKMVELHGKLLNLSDELSVKVITDVEKFKQLTGESPIEGEKKYIQAPIRFKNYAKMVCAANRLPPIENADKAFFSRVIMMKFLNSFSPDAEFIKRITTPEELSGLLNLALEGLKRLYEQKEFTLKTPVMELEQEWNIDLVQEFIQEKVIASSDSDVSFLDLYKAFLELCESREEKPCSKETFAIRLSGHLKKMSVQVTKKKAQKEGQRLWVYKGIRLASSETDEHLHYHTLCSLSPNERDIEK